MSQKTHAYVEAFADVADAMTYIESQILNYSNEDWKLGYVHITFTNTKYRVGIQFVHGQYVLDIDE